MQKKFNVVSLFVWSWKMHWPT